VRAAVERKDALAYHYMTHVSGIAFGGGGDNGTAAEFATCQDSTNRYGAAEAWDAARDWRWENANRTDAAAEAAEGTAGNNFMGPSLWRVASYAVDNQQYGPEKWHKDADGRSRYGSHIDMLHQSPRCVGITFDGSGRRSSGTDDHPMRSYWAVDDGWGAPLRHGPVVHYDFDLDHGEGGSNHTAARVVRYRGFMLTRVPGVASQPVFDPAQRMLYVADAGGGRVVKINVSAGVINETDVPPFAVQMHALTSYKYADVPAAASWSLGAGVLGHPSGLALRVEGTTGEAVLFVSDFGTSKIHVLFAANGESAMASIDVIGGSALKNANQGAGLFHGLSGLAIRPATNEVWAVHAVAPAVIRVVVAEVGGRPSATPPPRESAPSPSSSSFHGGSSGDGGGGGGGDSGSTMVAASQRPGLGWSFMFLAVLCWYPVMVLL
jgi:hypothetical protein